MLFSEIDRRSANRNGVEKARRYLNSIGLLDADVKVIGINQAIICIDNELILIGRPARLFTVLNML